MGEVEEAKKKNYSKLPWDVRMIQNPFAQFPHMWPLLWQIAPSQGSSASPCTMYGHPSKSRAKVARVYLLNSPVVYPATSSPATSGIQLGGPLGWTYPGGDGLQEALCEVVRGEGLSSAGAHLEMGRHWASCPSQLAHPHLSSELEDAASSAAFKDDTTCTTEMKEKRWGKKLLSFNRHY